MFFSSCKKINSILKINASQKDKVFFHSSITKKEKIHNKAASLIVQQSKKKSQSEKTPILIMDDKNKLDENIDLDIDRVFDSLLLPVTSFSQAEKLDRRNININNEEFFRERNEGESEYNILMSAQIEQNRADLSLNTFDALLKSKNVKANLQHYTTAIKACAFMKDYERGKKLFKETKSSKNEFFLKNQKNSYFSFQNLK